MSSVFKQLREWRTNRNICEYEHRTQVENIVEEMLELMYPPKSSLIKQFKYEISSKYFADETINEEKIDAYCDLIVFSINAIELLGYDAKKCMDETIKEISSRKQNPIQKQLWANGNKSSKWEKDSEQDKSTLYTANYKECKLGGN